MGEKKMERKYIFSATIAVLCVTTILFLGLWSGADQEARTLGDKLGELEDSYDELNSTLGAGEAIAESAEWVSEDKRLKVTSELIPEMWDSYLASYTVRVTITNVGDEPLDRVVIFLLPYIDGKFADEYTGYRSHSIENIYMGETNSHDFEWIPKNMTSYKVLVVAG